VTHPQPTTPQTQSGPGASARSRRRRNVFGGSAQRDEYVRLYEGGWTSAAIEAYAWHRYGEDIPASTIRTWCTKHQVQRTAEVLKLRNQPADPDRTLDIAGLRAQLIQLQAARILIDAEHERSMTKLFGSTRGEIALLNDLLTAHKGDLQDMGLMGKAGEKLTVHRQDGPEPERAPRERSLQEAFGLPPDADATELAKVIHLGLKRAEQPAVAG
jgi:hypothetical protein